MEVIARSAKRPCTALLRQMSTRTLQTKSSPGSSTSGPAHATTLSDVDAKLDRLERVLAELKAERRHASQQQQQNANQSTAQGGFGGQNGSAVDTALGLTLGTAILGIAGTVYFSVSGRDLRWNLC